MAYNFNANQFYSKPNHAFQPRNLGYAPAFGHQVNAAPYPYYPANAYGILAPQTLPSPHHVAPLAPLSPLPTPGQFLSHPHSVLPAGVNAPFWMNAPVGSSQSLAVPRPQVQQHFYTLPGLKEPASRKKSIKKFLLITSAVVTGVFATAASVMGLMWMFWPGFVNLGKNIGTEGAAKAANAVKEWKKPGPPIQRLINTYEAYARQGGSSAKSGWQQLKDLFKSNATIEAEDKAAEKANEKAMAEIKEAGSGLAPLLNGLHAQDIDSLKEFFKKMGLDLERLTSSKYMAEVINKVEPQKVTAILEPLVPAVLKAVLPEDAAKILAAARETGNTSQLAEQFWNLLKEEQQTGIYNQLSRIATQAMDEYGQSFSKNGNIVARYLLSKKTPPVNPVEAIQQAS